jgi:hypothetical protein
MVVVNIIQKETGLRERRRKRRSYLEAFGRWQSAVGTCVHDGAQASQPHFSCVERPALHVGRSLGGLRVLVVARQLQLKRRSGLLVKSRIAVADEGNVGVNKLKCAIRRAACLRKITPNLELLNPNTCRPHPEYLYIFLYIRRLKKSFVQS